MVTVSPYRARLSRAGQECENEASQWSFLWWEIFREDLYLEGQTCTITPVYAVNLLITAEILIQISWRNKNLQLVFLAKHTPLTLSTLVQCSPTAKKFDWKCVNHKPWPWFAFLSQADYDKSLVKQENIVFSLIHYGHLSINKDVCVAVELWPFWLMIMFLVNNH